MPKKFLTLSEAVSRLQESDDDSELEDPAISIIPPEPDNLSDLEDVNDEDVGDKNRDVRDVVGECEIPTKEDLDQFIKARKPITITWEKEDNPNIGEPVCPAWDKKALVTYADKEPEEVFDPLTRGLIEHLITETNRYAQH